MSSSSAALPVRSPRPLAQLCTSSAPASTPASSVATAIPKSLCVCTSTGSPFVNRFTSRTRYFMAPGSTHPIVSTMPTESGGASWTMRVSRLVRSSSRARRIVRKIDDFEVVCLRVAHDLDALSQDVFPGPLELPQQLRVADRHLEDHAVDAALQRLVDIGGDGSNECVDPGGEPKSGDLLDCRDIVVGDRGHSCLDAIDAHRREHFRDRN